MRRSAWALACAALVAGSAASAAPAGPRRASFIPLWSPQAQFAGYYMAHEKGFYRARGLDVTVLQGGPDMPPAALLARGEADFGTLWLSEAIQLRARGMRLVNLSQVTQVSALVLIAKKSSGIRVPRDMDGKKVGLWENFQIQPRAFFRKYGLRVREVRQSHSINLFLRGGVDAASAMLYNEYHTMLNSGLDAEDLIVFRFDEHGLNFPEDGIYALEETYRKDPGRACAFVQATREGWEYAFAHPEETLDAVLARMRAANVPADRVHQRWMLNRMRELIAPSRGGSPAGRLKPLDYARVARELRESGLIATAPSYESFAATCAAP